jgi:stearoyl-CoA desaturase (delta-9 desaturase)
MFKKISLYSWFSFVPFVTLALATIILMVKGTISLHYLWGTLVGWFLISGLGIATGYHRVFSHKTHDLPRWKENIILFFAALAGQGSSITWVAVHRGLHHPYADTPKDLHSPVAYSAWHAFFGWTTKITEANPNISMRYSVDLLRKPNHVWFHNNNMKLLWGVPLFVAFFYDWQAALAWFCLPTGFALLQDNLVNVFGHRKGLIGYRVFDTPDNSQNNVLLGWFAFGQGWHNNHHYDPKPFNLGSGISGKWWEFDPCVIFLPFLGKPR